MTNRFNLNHRTILVTGAAGGIGRASAQALLAQGADVILCDRLALDPSSFAAASQQVRSYVCDVTERGSVNALLQAEPAVDGLVLSAGVLPFDDWMDAQWDASFDRVMDVNVRGIMNLMRAYFPGMCERRAGHVVLVGSASGRMGGMQAGPHYAASKGAVHALVRWFSQRGAPCGVCVNGIAPGSIDTEMLAGQPFAAEKIPLGRMGKAEEIGWPIAFLCSDAASYMSGAVIDVNGGLVYS